MEYGKIIKIDDDVVTVEEAKDRHFIGLHVSCCVGFIPKLGDLVAVSDSSDDEWIIKKITK